MGCQDVFDRCSWRCRWGVVISAHPVAGRAQGGFLERFGARISDKKRTRAIRRLSGTGLSAKPTLPPKQGTTRCGHTHPTLEAVPRRRNSAKESLFLRRKKREKKSRRNKEDVPVEETWDLKWACRCRRRRRRRDSKYRCWLDLVAEKTQSHTQPTP